VPGEVRIREMEIGDLPGVYDLGERLFSAEALPILYRTWDEYDVVDLFSADGETCLVAELEGRLVGFVLGSVIQKRRGAWTYGYLEWIGVDPACGRRGIGRRLFRSLTERFVGQGVRMIIVDTESDNRDAIAFFRSLGFGQEHRHVYLSLNLTHHPEYVKWRLRNGRPPPRIPDDS
jgi:ribosomal protein S18 acetylase RimI-like enzyme